MKPATLALFSFLLSLLVYNFIGILLVLVSGVNSQAGSQISIIGEVLVSIVLAILTALYVFKFERE